MDNYSNAEKQVIASRQIDTILTALSSISSKAANLETQLSNLTPEMIEQIAQLAEDVATLMTRNYIIGGNLTVSDTAPTNPKENDIWFDTKLARR